MGLQFFFSFKYFCWISSQHEKNVTHDRARKLATRAANGNLQETNNRDEYGKTWRKLIMGFFTDLLVVWALGGLFWGILKIFSYAYITIWRLFGSVFTVWEKAHKGVHRLLIFILRLPLGNNKFRGNLTDRVKPGAALGESPVRAFLFIFAPWIGGAALVYKIKMVQWEGGENLTQFWSIGQIFLIVVLLIAIFPTKAEQQFFIAALSTNILRTLRDILILGAVIVIYVWEIDQISTWDWFGTYFFEFSMLVGGYFAVDGGLWMVGKGLRWGIERVTRIHASPASYELSKPPKAWLRAEQKAMFPRTRYTKN